MDTEITIETVVSKFWFCIWEQPLFQRKDDDSVCVSVQMCIGCVLMHLFIYSTNPVYVRCCAVAGEYNGEQLEVVSRVAFPGKVIRHSPCSRLKCSDERNRILFDPPGGAGRASWRK